MIQHLTYYFALINAVAYIETAVQPHISIYGLHVRSVELEIYIYDIVGSFRTFGDNAVGNGEYSSVFAALYVYPGAFYTGEIIKRAKPKRHFIRA
jgi:hypothetical protein